MKTLIFKTACPKCKKALALKTKADWYSNGDLHIHSSKCYQPQCGFKLPASSHLGKTSAKKKPT